LGRRSVHDIITSNVNAKKSLSLPAIWLVKTPTRAREEGWIS
jgi:hypothetical protein